MVWPRIEGWGTEPFIWEWRFVFFIVLKSELEEHIVAVWEEEATEKSVRGTPGPKPFQGWGKQHKGAKTESAKNQPHAPRNLEATSSARGEHW